MTAGLKCPPEMAPKEDTATASASPCANATGIKPVPGAAEIEAVTIAPAPITKNMNVPAISASSARVCSVTAAEC